MVSWIEPTQKNTWLFQKTGDLVAQANTISPLIRFIVDMAQTVSTFDTAV